MKKYKTIYIDPPWKYNDSLDKTRKLKYELLSIEEISEIPIQKIACNKSHLYMWTVKDFLHDSFHLLEKWEFEFKQVIPWLKRTRTGKIHFGMGHWFRNSIEYLIFGVKGNLKIKTKSTRNIVFDAPIIDCISKGKSTNKPISAYDLIEKESYPPYIEIFATEKRDGWKSFGYGINKNHNVKIITELL